MEFKCLLFVYIFGCLLSRLGIAYLIKEGARKWLKYISAMYLVFGLGIGFLWLTKMRTSGAFREKIWWDDLRPVHALTFLFVSYASFRGMRGWAWKMVVADVVISLVAFINKHQGELMLMKWA